jgi:hypothetical protein
LNKCTSLEDRTLVDSRFKYSLSDQLTNVSLKKIVIENDSLPDTLFQHNLPTLLAPLKHLDINCERGSKVERFPTPSSAHGEDSRFYNIIMPYTSFDTISITCINSGYDGIVLAVKQVIGNVEHVQYFVNDFNSYERMLF